MNPVLAKIERWLTLKVVIGVIVGYFYLTNFFPPHIIDAIICGSWCGTLCDWLYNGISGNWVYALLTATALLAVVLTAEIKSAVNGFFYTALGVTVGLLAWIGFDNYWAYPTVVYDEDFRIVILAVLLFGIASLLIFSKGARGDAASSPQNDGDYSVSGLTDDSLRYRADEAILSYARMLSAKLQRVKVSEASYAVGVESRWGTGKTTFLDSLKGALPSGSIIVDFNPWQNLSEKSLVWDFFEKLAETVETKLNLEIFPPIQKYASALLAIEGDNGFWATLKNIFSNYSETTVRSLKQKISESLGKAQKKVFVFIDDMDRLDGDEIYEVLRLVRNTANFPNVVYVAAYDKDYVVAQLQNKGISKSDHYLEKIFNLEICLPKTEADQLERELIYELDEMLPEDLRRNEFPTKLVRYKLHTYRDIRRFARQFAVNYMFMHDNLGDEEFNADNLFCVELLRYINRPVFESLKNDYGDILDHKFVPVGLYELSLKEDFKNKLESEAPDSLELITYMLEGKRESDTSIACPNNLRRYFSFKLEPETISKSDFRSWFFDGSVSLDALVRKASKRRSLLFQFSIFSLADLSLQQVVKYFEGLIGLCLHAERHDQIMLNILADKWRRDNNPIIGSDEFISEISVRLNDVNDVKSLRKLSELYKAVKAHGDTAMTPLIERLEVENFKRLLSTSAPDTMDMLDSKSSLRILYSNSIVWKEEDCFYDDGEPYTRRVGESPLISEVCQYFESHRSDKRGDFNETLLYYPVTDGVEVYYEPIPDECAEHEIITVFGNHRNYENFMNSAFN